MCATERHEPRSLLGRASDVLATFDASHHCRTLSDIARAADLPKSTALRICTELTRLGMLEHDDDGYRLGLRLFELGELVSLQRGLRDLAVPYMEDLRAATQATVHLAVLEGVEVVYVSILPGTSGPRLPSRVGGRLPAHATGVGKAILAFAPAEAVEARVAAGLPALTARTIVTPGRLRDELRSVRERGVALDREEAAVGLLCAAAPIIGPDGTPVGAMSVSGVSSGLLDRSGAAVRTAALALGRRLSAAG